MKKLILFYIVACIIAYLVGFWVGTARADYDMSMILEPAEYLYSPPESPEDYGPVELTIKNPVDDNMVDPMGRAETGPIYIKSEFQFPEATTIQFGDGDCLATIDVDGLRSLTPEEAQKVAAAIQLLGGSTVYWSVEMSNAIVEVFIPERFKVKKDEGDYIK